MSKVSNQANYAHKWPISPKFEHFHLFIYIIYIQIFIYIYIYILLKQIVIYIQIYIQNIIDSNPHPQT